MSAGNGSNKGNGERIIGIALGQLVASLIRDIINWIVGRRRRPATTVRIGVKTMGPLAMQQEALRLLAATIDTAALGASIEIRLFQNDITITNETVLADLDEADYTGYAMQPAEGMGTAYDDAAGNVMVVYPSKVFQPSGTAVGNTVYGWYAVGETDSDWDNLLICAQRFPDPLPMNGPADAAIVQPVIGFNQPVNLQFA